MNILRELKRKFHVSRYLTVNEFAEFSGYYAGYVYTLTRSGKLSSYKVGGQKRIPLEAALQFGSKWKNCGMAKSGAVLSVDLNGMLTGTRKRRKTLAVGI